MVRDAKPDLVITNVFLKGLRGHDVMQRLRSEFPELRILLVSGLPDSEAVRTWANEDGFDAFPKPFTADALKQKVREVLTGAPQPLLKPSGSRPPPLPLSTPLRTTDPALSTPSKPPGPEMS
jgi:DNA-binding response OmpR family regulator